MYLQAWPEFVGKTSFTIHLHGRTEAIVYAICLSRLSGVVESEVNFDEDLNTSRER